MDWNLILDELKHIGYDVASSLEIINNYKEEIKRLPPRKYNYYVGLLTISFTKV